MKKILILFLLGMVALIGCSTGKGKVKVAKGYIPTDPFPPLPTEAKAYVAVGKAKFKKDKQTAEDMARIAALGVLAENFRLEAVRSILEEVKDATTEGEGKRVYEILTRIRYQGPIPGKKFKDKVVGEKTGEVIVRIYVARPEVDEVIIPYYLKRLREISTADYADQMEQKYLEIFKSKEFEREKERQLEILRDYNHRVQQELLERIL
ncbi:MAG: hypothetical protein JSV56_04545 [Methanomassiliicoccales archaeon]|nr:MAG: hypothetical protein JSV56_04545 [Methanomassiliicoccales archaeon]